MGTTLRSATAPTIPHMIPGPLLPGRGSRSVPETDIRRGFHWLSRDGDRACTPLAGRLWGSPAPHPSPGAFRPRLRVPKGGASGACAPCGRVVAGAGDFGVLVRAAWTPP